MSKPTSVGVESGTQSSEHTPPAKPRGHLYRKGPRSGPPAKRFHKQAYELWAAGSSLAKIAKTFGVSDTTAWIWSRLVNRPGFPGDLFS